MRGDAIDWPRGSPGVDLAYLDPPYNQHRYVGNYHVWETLMAWDAPAHYGVACKRVDLRDGREASVFNRRRQAPAAMAALLAAVRAEVVIISGSDEGWIGMEELAGMVADRGEVRVLAFDSKRYVGAQIGIHGPTGKKVGRVGRTRNMEYLIVAGSDSASRRPHDRRASRHSAGEELPGAPVRRGVTQLGHGPRLDLTDPFPGQAEVLAHLVEGPGLTPVEAEAQAQDLPLALVEGHEHLVDLARQQGGRGGVEGRHRGAVLDDITELGVPVLTERLGQRERLGGVAEDLGDLLLLELQVGGELGDRRAPAELTFEAAAGLGDPGEQVSRRAPADGRCGRCWRYLG